MRAYKCDRCGKLFEKYKNQWTSEFFNITRNPCMSGNCLDLCPNCNAELQEWVANGKEQAVKDLLPGAESEVKE
jgi:hypothetical protein